MNVLHVIPSVAPCRGGPSVAVIAMARELRALGLGCDILATDDDGPGRLDVPNGEWREIGGARVWFLPRWSPRGPRALREFAIGRGLDAWLDERLGSYDLLHVHALFSHMSSRAMARARRAGVPYILRPLGLLEDFSMKRSSFKKTAALALFDRANMRGAAALHWTSEREREISSIARGCPGWVVPLGVDAPPEVPQREARAEPSILFLSRWAPKKRIELLLDALGGMLDLPWKLVLAGGCDDRGYKEKIRAAVASCGFAERISLPGFLSGENKMRALAEADLFALPSASENFGIAVAEALAWGVPCIVSEGVALSSEIAEAGAGWVAPEGGLEPVLRTALREGPERRRRGIRAAALAGEKMSWAACASAMASRYETILEK